MSSGSLSPPAGLDEAVLDEFVETLLAAQAEAADCESLSADEARRRVIDEYSARHPLLAEEFQELAAMGRLLRHAEQPAEGSSATRAALAAPAHLPDFRIVRQIASGGMGTVYEAVQESLGRRVAVKVRGGRVSPADQARFLREQQVLAQLHQTHIVPIHTAGHVGPWQYFAMAYIEGAALHHVVAVALRHALSRGGKTPTLAELAGIALHRRGTHNEADESSAAETTPLVDPASGPDVPHAASPAQVKVTLTERYFRSVAEVMADAAEALHHAHQAGVLHRDIKPSNLMVDTSGHCWLVDFGLARWLTDSPMLEAMSEGVGSAAAALTRGPMGTPEYMAPEQHEGRTDVGCDVWGLGATLYELLSLRPAFSSTSYAAIRQRVLAGDCVPLDELVDGLPPDLAAICRKSLNTHPRDRYETAAAFAEDLRRWLRGEPTEARPAGAPRRAWLWARRNKGWAAFLASSLVGLLAVSGIGLVLENNRTAAARAEAQASQDREQDHKRELMLQQLQRLRLTTRRGGWRDEGWRHIQEIVEIRGGQDAATEAAALLAGLDARIEAQLSSPAASVAFDREGQRLLVGGANDAAGKPQSAARLWDLESDRVSPADDADRQSTARRGEGLVAFAADGAPLQLLARDAVTLELWDVVEGKLRRGFKLTDDAEPLPLTAWNQPRMAISADGSLIAGGTDLEVGNRVAVYETAGGKLLRRLEVSATALAISPDGKLLAIGDDQGRVSLLALGESSEPVVLERGRMRIHSLAFARDPWSRPIEGDAAQTKGLLLAAGDAGGAVTIWDVPRRAPRTLCAGSVRDVYAVAFSPDATLLATAGRSQTTLWDAASGRMLLYLPNQDYVAGLAFSGDGRRLAVASQTRFFPGAVSVYALSDGAGIQTLRGLSGQIERPCLSPDGRFVAALAHDWQVGIWDRASGQLLHVLEAPRGMFADNADLAFSPDGSQFVFSVSNLREGVITLWDMQQGRQVRTWKIAPGLQNQLAFTADGKLLHFQVETKDGRSLPVSAADFSQHPRVCRIRELSGQGAARIAEVDTFPRHVYAAQADPRGKYFLMHGITGPQAQDRAVAVVESLTGSELLRIPLQSTADAAHLALDPSGQFLAYRPGDEFKLTVIELPAGQPAGALPALVLAIGPRAEFWCEAVIQPPYGCALHRGDDELPLVTLGVDASGMVIGAEFDSAGTHLAWGNPDGTVNLCDLQELEGRLKSVDLGW